MINASVDVSGLLKRLRKVPKEAPRIIKKAIDTDARGFVRDIVAITPPSQGKAETKSKRRGEDKIAADIRKAYGTPSDMWRLIKDRQGKDVADEFWARVKNKQWKQANDIARRITGKELDVFDQGSEHKRRRNPKTGRVVGGAQPKHKSVFLLPSAMAKLKRYTKEEQKLVGLLASGFVPAAKKLGVKLPAWITRHQTKPGFITPRTTNAGYSLTISNTARYGRGADLPRRIRDVLGYDKRKKRIANVIKYEIRAVLKRQGLT